MKNNKLFKLATFIGISVLGMSMFVGCADANAPKQDNNTPAAEAPTQGNEYITMGTNAEFEPFEYREGSDIVGFDVEIAKAIAAQAGKELKIEDMEFGTLIVGLNNNQMDFIAAGMSVTEERKTQVDFSEPYFTSKQMIIVKSDDGSIQTADDLVGKKVGVQLGTTGDLFVSGTDGVEVLQFDKAPLAVMELQSDKIDAVVIDAEPAKRLVEGQDDIKVLDVPFIEEEYAIAVRKGDTELLDLINGVIKEIKENGEYDKIFEQFFGGEE